MEKTLQVQYNLIKEGKGDKAYFLKSAYRLFPDMLSPVNTFEDTTRILKNRGVISENIGGLVTTGKKQDWHAIFNENITTLKEEKEAKAEEKETTKEVTDMATRGYDYKDEKNYDNIFGEEFLKGYYTEMKDPKNTDKDVEELRAIVAKNLAKDISYYVKNGQFGVKDLGYTTEAPGLGEPKEPKGKFKSSGYGDLKESVLRLVIQDLIKEVLTEEKEFKKGDKVTYNGEEVEIVGKSMWAKKDGSDSSVPQPITYDLKTKDGVVKDISPKSLSEALDMDAIKNEGEDAKKKVMERRITNEIVKRKKQIKALETLTELEGGEDNVKKVKELQSEIKKLEGAKNKLHNNKKVTKEKIVDEGQAEDLKKKEEQAALQAANFAVQAAAAQKKEAEAEFRG
jgi:SOS response regulatory protein OraA/RecX